MGSDDNYSLLQLPPMSIDMLLLLESMVVLDPMVMFDAMPMSMLSGNHLLKPRVKPR